VRRGRLGHGPRLQRRRLPGAATVSRDNRRVDGWPPASPRARPVITIEASAGVRLVTLDRPEARNAFNRALYEATTHAIVEARSDPDIHVVVVTGAGSAFSAGQDLK